MVRIWTSIGSNIEREYHIRLALEKLEQELGNATISPIYECPSEGFDGPDFYNLVAGYQTSMLPDELIKLFNRIESELGRTRTEKKFSSRTIDIDLLTYGDEKLTVLKKQLPRDDILKYSFVLKPLADVAPDEIHADTGRTYLDHWQEMALESTPIYAIEGIMDSEDDKETLASLLRWKTRKVP